MATRKSSECWFHSGLGPVLACIMQKTSVYGNGLKAYRNGRPSMDPTRLKGAFRREFKSLITSPLLASSATLYHPNPLILLQSSHSFAIATRYGLEVFHRCCRPVGCCIRFVNSSLLPKEMGYESMRSQSWCSDSRFRYPPASSRGLQE